jgi:hypothetical protein
LEFLLNEADDFRDFPPSQKPAAYNLGEVMESMIKLRFTTNAVLYQTIKRSTRQRQ